ncbi:MAG: hypothetical protein U0936_02915 [Planctomycetaceae bacterium]
MIRKSAKAWLACLLISSAGCNAIQDHCVSFETNMRNTVLAQKGWRNWASCYENVNYKLHFSNGFRDGYTNILEGGKGCQPTLPPRCYWKPQFQTPEGRARTNAWFDGFSHGAVAAQQDGFGSLQQLPISPTARANLLARQAPPSASCFSGMSQPDEADPVYHPEIHGGNAVDEPPMEILKTPELEMPPEPNVPGAAQAYDEKIPAADK